MQPQSERFMRGIEQRTQYGPLFSYKLACGHHVQTELTYGVGNTLYCSQCEGAAAPLHQRAHRYSEAARLLTVASVMAGQGNGHGAIAKARGAITQLKLLSTGNSGQSAAGNQQRPTEWISKPQRRKDDHE